MHDQKECLDKEAPAQLVELTPASAELLASLLTAKHESTSIGPKLLTVDEVAGRLQVSRRFVEELISKGELTPIRIGRVRRFEWSQVDAFIRAKSQTRRRR